MSLISHHSIPLGLPMERLFIVAGGAGFIGSHMVDFLLENYPSAKVTCLDKLSYASGNLLQNLQDALEHENFSFHQVDLATSPDIDYVVEREFLRAQFATVFNFAAESCVDRSFDDPVFFSTNNILATQRLFEACQKAAKKQRDRKNGEVRGNLEAHEEGEHEHEHRERKPEGSTVNAQSSRPSNLGSISRKRGLDSRSRGESELHSRSISEGLDKNGLTSEDCFHFIHISTDEVYGEQISGSVDEDAPLLPSNPYAASKAACDLLLHSYTRAYNAPISILRSNNVYGPRQHSEKIVSRVLKTLGDIENGRVLHIPIHGTGRQTRHYLHVHDFCRAADLVARSEPGEVYNVGSVDEMGNLALICRMFQMYGRTDYHRYVRYVEDRPFNDSRYAVLCERIAGLGWSQQISLDQGLTSLIQEITQNVHDPMVINV